VPVEIETKKNLKGGRHAEGAAFPLLQKEKTMRVRMLVDMKGAPDGIHVNDYASGNVYDLPESLAIPWLERGICEQDKILEGPSEKKDEAAGPFLRKKKRK